MSALELQRLLAELYTNPRMLAQFLRDRGEFCRRHGPESGEFFERIDARELQYFAASLVSKRAGEARKLLPVTARALGAGFREEFNRHAERTIPGGDRRHAADAMAFCEHLLKEARGLNPLAREAARYEMTALGARFKLKREGSHPVVCRAIVRRGPWLRLKRFAYEIPALAGRDDNEAISERATLALFARLPGLKGIWYW